MNICSEKEYHLLVDGMSNLCAVGFVSSDYCAMFDIDFDNSRVELYGSYQEFKSCCEWLIGCQFDDYATHFSPDSLRIKAKIDACSLSPVSNGSLIAAVMYLDLPHVVLGKTPNIAIAISRFCPRFQASATASF